MLMRHVSEAVDRLGLAGGELLVAVSGGIDSTALLYALHELAEEKRLKLSLGHVNHGLRGAESEADAEAVRALAGRLALPIRVVRGDPRPLREAVPSRDRPTLQEAARRVRYAALREIAGEGVPIATAHSADDQAETVLLRLLRGSGPDGLAGIPERSPDGCIVRPLLRVTRSEIERFAHERRLTWREDASNARLDYARNRLRHRWLPGLAREFNPRVLRAIAHLAEAQRWDSEWIGVQVEREAALRFAAEGRWLRIEAKDWDALPEALARRLVRAAVQRCGAGRLVSRVHLARMLDFLRRGRPGTRLELPGGLTLRRGSTGFRLGPLPSAGRGGVDPGGAC
jgi:tRNA(Ile)-lysidine synthase